MLPVLARAGIEHSGTAQVPFQAAAVITDRQAEENPSQAKREQRKHNGETVNSLIYVTIILLNMAAVIINNSKWTD